ncbi:MAG: LytR C-terminal domain-containing protein [Calditrichia bacterium]|nr:LytR C-terminal domain-containing protein [Calditrichia bacterium]
MRRKRRQSTQIIHKKTTSSPPVSSYYSSPKPKRGGRKILFIFALVIVLGSLSYYFYNLKLQKDDTQPPESGIEEITTSPVEPEEEERQPPPMVHTIQVEILNGCGINGVARIFQSLLRENGFDVVNTENYVVKGKVFWKVDQTFIIDQIGVAEQAKSIAKALGIPLTNIESRENPAAIYDISVVIGKDYKKYIKQ